MPFDKPSLDTRTFDQLVAETRRKIPLLVPGWTDHNASDPGITLSELVAGIVEQDLFRLDRIPDRQMRSFLRLVGIEQRPPGVARGFVAFATDLPAMALPRGLQLSAGGILVETARNTRLSIASIASAASICGPAATDLTASLSAAQEDVFPFGPDAAEDCIFAIGFDAPLGAPGAPVDLAIWRADPAADAAAWAALIAEWRAARRDARLLGREAGCLRPLRPNDDVDLAWEYWSAAGGWAPLAVKDTTRGLSLSGWLRFAVPADHAAGGIAAGLHSIRARIAHGRYTCPPRLRGLRLNAVPVRHAARVSAPEELGESHGRAGERFQAALTPIVVGSSRIAWVKGESVDAAWTEAAAWDLAGPHDRTFVLDPEEGTFAFGNGWRGRVPDAGWTVTADYCVGGGVAGNLARGGVTAIAVNPRNLALVPGLAGLAPQIAVDKPAALFGGTPAETLAETKARAIDRIGRVAKAVSIPDYETLACEVPGIAVARARAIARRHPILPKVAASGCITVVVIPDCRGPRPTPQPGFLNAVAAWLDRRRMITAEVRVVAPCYEEVAVTATLHLDARADVGKAAGAAEAALDAYFHPLTGGPDGGGWPVGRPVYCSEVMALLASVDGVEAVTELGLSGPRDAAPVCTNLEFCGDCLPVSGRHAIIVQSASVTRLSRRSDHHECC